MGYSVMGLGRKGCFGLLLSLGSLFAAGALSAAGPVGTVIGWGSVGWFGLTPPPNLTNAVAVSVSAANCLALNIDGTVIGWGNGNDLGAAHPPSGLSNVVAIASGEVHSLALKADGTLVGWGNDYNGQTDFPSGLTNVTAIAAGRFHSMALSADGCVWVWGNRNISPNLTNVPVNVTNVIAIGAGGSHCLAVRADGTVVAWGLDDNGQCDVPQDLSGVIAVACGMDYSLALKNDGTVVAWGEGRTSYPAGLTNIVSIATGCEAWHCLALRNDGVVLGWGDNLFGPLDGPAPYTNLAAISVGYGVSLGITLEPVIVSQPTGISVLAGTNLSLTVGVVGSVQWGYQWFCNGTNLPGQTLGTLSFTNVQISDSGNYSVTASNQYGTITSSSASVVVQPFPPTWVVQPTNQVRLAGGTASFAVSVVGAAPLFYQWYFNDKAISGATNAILELTSVTDTNAGRYQLVVANAYGTNSSPQVTLTVNDPPTITNTPTILSLPAGTNWILNVDGTGTSPLFYQWQFQGSSLSGAIYTSLVLSNIQSANIGQYAVVVSNEFGIVTNAICSLSIVDSAPVIYQQPASQAFLPGGNITLRVLAYGTAPLTSQWWFNGSLIPGATNQSLALTNLQSTNEGSYFITLSNAFGFTNSSIGTLSVGDPYLGQVDWPQLSFAQVVTNRFSAPMCLTHAGDGSGRLFVVEKQGRIWIVQDGTALTQPFLVATNRVLSSAAEQGLLGLAFPPGFSTNRHFYVDYTRQPDGAVVISRFLLTTNANVADANSEQVLLVIPKSYSNDNGGQLAFGVDGLLYIGTGDGGYQSTPDPYTNAQNTGVLLGKLLRIDAESGVAPYSVPINNPFVGNTNYAPEIWALGLRNPRHFSFDSLTGDLYLGDVGQSWYDEIDFQPAGSLGGQNYGWRIQEGPTTRIVPPGFTNFSSLTLPVTWYSHSGGTGVIGGNVYRGPSEARMNGVYFYGDYSRGVIWGMRQVGTNWQTSLLNTTSYRISTFAEDDQLRLYLADYNSGCIYQIGDTRQVLTPAYSPPNGTVYSNLVTVTCATPGATIHFTTDGRDPTELDSIAVPGGTIQVRNGTTTKIRAYRPDLTPSPVASAVFTFRVATPSFAPAQGPITNGTSISLACATPGAAIYYTLDGSTPTTNSALYSAPLSVNGGVTVSALGVASGYLDSTVRTVFYSLVQTATPVFSPGQGPITNGTTISLSCDTPGAVIYYTLDGSAPTTNSAAYSSPLLVNGGVTVSALGVANHYLDSTVQSVTYALVKTAMPTFAPSHGPLTNGALIQMSGAPGATIRYTIDGTAPDTNSAILHAPLLFSGPVTLRARSYVPELAPSDIVSTFYGLSDSENPVVVTVAGSTTAGFSNALGTLARFSSPVGVCLDSSGNLYVADSGNNVIRKISPSGQVTTFAGTGVAGSQLGQATNAQFSVPTGVCADNVGNVYVVDRSGCNRVCKIDTNGIVSTLVNLTQCFGYAPGTWQLTVDDAGNVYAGYWATVERITPAGAVSQLAGSGGNCDSGWCENVGPGLDAATNIYAATEYKVWKVAPNGASEVFAGSGSGFSDGPRLLSLFQNPLDATVDSATNVFISDGARIRRIRPDGWVSTLAGTGVAGYANGRGPVAQFNNAAGLCADAKGNIYVADAGNNCIRKISPDSYGIGIPDDWQLANFGFVGIDPNADPDHDGMSNLAEYIAGTEPTNALSVLKLSTLTTDISGTTVTWKSVNGVRYFLERSAKLGACQSFFTLATNIVGQAGTTSYLDTNPVASDELFYRVGVQTDSYQVQIAPSAIPFTWLQQYGLPTDGSADYADTDGDGHSNWHEWRAGTNPRDASSVLRMLTASNSASGLRITWESVAGVKYYLQRSSLWSGSPFSAIQSNIFGQPSKTTYTDTNAAGVGPFFYRVGIQ